MPRALTVWVFSTIILPDREIRLLWSPAEHLGEVANLGEVLVVVPGRESPPHLPKHGTPTAKVDYAVVLGIDESQDRRGDSDADTAQLLESRNAELRLALRIGGVTDGESGAGCVPVLRVAVHLKLGANSSILIAKLPVENRLDVRRAEKEWPTRCFEFGE